MTTSFLKGLAIAVVAAATAVACGGGSTPTTPTPPTSTTPPPSTTPPSTTPPSTPTDSATITIGTDGRVSPATVTILRGGRVTMINNHTRPHEIASDPHPEHSGCPELNQWGFLQPGQRGFTLNMNTARTCRFHDHGEPSNTGLQGSVIIQ